MEEQGLVKKIHDATEELNLLLDRAFAIGLRVEVDVESMENFGTPFPLKIVTVTVFKPLRGDDEL